MKPLSKAQRMLLAEKYGGKCAYCGCTLPDRWHADHIYPILRNDYGAEREHLHIVENMNPACPPPVQHQ